MKIWNKIEPFIIIVLFILIIFSEIFCLSKTINILITIGGLCTCSVSLILKLQKKKGRGQGDGSDVS